MTAKTADGWYWLDTGKACGGVEVRAGRIATTPPVWKEWQGKPAAALFRQGRWVEVPAPPPTAPDPDCLQSLGLSELWQAGLLLPSHWLDLGRVEERLGDHGEGDALVLRGTLAAAPQVRFGRSPRLVGRLRLADARTVGFTLFGDTRALQPRLRAGGPACLRGRLRAFNGSWWLHGAALVEPGWAGRLQPVYPGETGAAGADAVRDRVVGLLAEAVPAAVRRMAAELSALAGEDRLPALAGCPDWTLEDIVWMAHLPGDEARGRRAQRALELLAALAAALRAGANRPAVRRQRRLRPGDWRERARALPFALTGEQAAAVEAIVADLGRDVPMRRLLSGDVGTGKTAVYGLALAACLDGGGRTAVLLPNQALAAQVARALGTWWPNLPPVLVSAETPEGADLAGVPLVAGTTALLGRDIGERDLIVVDEQQKFSRGQREQLPGRDAHLLEVTATCIPRSQALLRYGVLDVCRLALAHVAKTIHTRVWESDQRAALFAEVRATVAAGYQVLVVYPARDGAGRAAAAAAFRLWEGRFPGRARLAHGALSVADKVQALEDLRAGLADILVATTVVEVGIDLPRLRRVVVVHAERFGLATLHQIRGRVARSGGAGYCDLYLPDPVGEGARERLAVLERTGDGFAVAEHDLRLRGFGDLGRESGRQSGTGGTLLRGRPLGIEAMDGAAAILEDLGRPERSLRGRD